MFCDILNLEGSSLKRNWREQGLLLTWQPLAILRNANGSEGSQIRWLKHLSLAHDDAALSEILEQFGPEGYGIYWLMLEHLAAGIEKDSEAVPTRTHSVVKWSQICHCSVRRFTSFAEKSTELGLIDSQTTSNRLQIDCPKLLKYRDEYSKKSGQTPRQIESRTDREEIRVKTDTVTPIRQAEIRKSKVIETLIHGLEFEELEKAHHRHLKQRAGHTLQLAAQTAISQNGKFDLLKFRDRHPRYCAYWDKKDWQFCPLTLCEWIENGMPEPPADATPKSKTDTTLEEFRKAMAE